MERDMATTIATKTDLQLLRQELLTGMASLATRDDLGVARADVAGLRHDLGVVQHDVATLRQDVGVLKQDVATLKQDVGVLKQDVLLIRKDMEIMPSQLTVRLGSMLVVSMTLLFAALKFS